MTATSLIQEIDTPTQARVFELTDDAYFKDSFQCQIDYQGESAFDLYKVMVETMPSWVNKLMALRNKIVKQLGLKNLGQMADFDVSKPESEYQVGDALGIFRIYSISRDELIVEDKDKHLNVRLSFYVEPEREANKAKLIATSVVHIHNNLGRVYMTFVGPVHKRIVPTSMKKIVKYQQQKYS
ncbi:DUF2867 domain-containing protein [Catenovulum sp. SM1970]|uniref:DUF2867 domain-containing protein n=1 Tax=Marinifaba aquimaris TaxID=2741323 RepID=UPI0015723777|nr:DUF2867 domain-containing protein [Marinifaba aquimaris]NTS75794.1 DUF2867 domain-containing protein [Marinifaba aquimaris]